MFALIIPLSNIGGNIPGLTPGNELPGVPVFPSQGLPVYPSGQPLPVPPPGVWPPLPPDATNKPIDLPPANPAGSPVHPWLPGMVGELPPGTIYPPLPPEVPKGKAIALVAISGTVGGGPLLTPV